MTTPNSPPPPPHDVQHHRFSISSAVLLGATLILGWVFLPLWRPLLFAAILAAALAGVQQGLTRRLWNQRYISAGVLTVAVVVLIITPLAVLATIAIREALEALSTFRSAFTALRTGGVDAAVRRLPDSLERWLKPIVERMPGGLKQLPTGSSDAGRWAAIQVQGALVTVSEFAFDVVMMLIALFFLLTDGTRFVDWIRKVSPLGQGRTRELLEEFRVVARSLIGANFITGGAQATVATIGYYIAGAPQPLFFGVLTLLASFIPSVGTAIVALPLSGIVFLSGRPWAALFLLAWSLLIVAVVDNLLRPLLLRGDLHVHGAIVFFVIIGGITLFGFAGLVVGPMALTFFLTTLRFYRRDLRRAENP